MKTTKLLLCFLALIVFKNAAAQNTKCLKEINNQIWANFTKAFETSDHNLFGTLHAEDFIRVSGNSKSIKGKTSYINGYQKNWEHKKNKETISFRFLERICNDTKASERGIFRFTRNPDTPDARSFYGKFHVIHIKTQDKWHILVDYDSSENESINSDSYNNAFAIDDLTKY